MITSNREVNEIHVTKLMESINKKNMLKINPIIVDENLTVIDGQHRLEAARLLEIPIFYVISGNVNKEDISQLNSIKLNWKPEDYLNYYQIEGNPHYSTISRFLNKYPEMRITTAISLLTGTQARNSDFKNGKTIVTDQGRQWAYLVAEKLRDLRRHRIEFTYERSFISAFTKVCRHPNFDYDRLIKKIETSPRDFVKCSSSAQYVDMILEVYNKHAQRSNHIDSRDL